jgi:O-antigen ligase
VDAGEDRRPFPIVLSKTAIVFFLGLFVAAQIVFSPAIDNLIKSFLASYFGLALPRSFERIPFKSLLIFWLIVLSVFISMRFMKTGIIWLINNKEKIFITTLLLSCHLVGITSRKLDIPGFAVLAVLFFWLIYIFTSDNYRVIWNYWHLFILFFLFSIVLSLVNCRPITLVLFLRIIPAFIAFFLMVNLIRNRETAIFAVKIYLLLATFSALIGIFQEIIYFYSGILLVGVIPEANRIYMWEPTFLGQLLRVPAFTGWYLNLGYLLSTALLIGVNLLLYSVVKGLKEKLLLLTVLILISIGLILTFSHGIILMVILAIMVSIFIRWRSLTIHFVAFILIGLLVAYSSGFLTNFVEEPKKYIRTEDVAIRIDLLRDGITGFFNRHPILGNGLGRGAKYTSNVDNWAVHNNIVLVADELGLLGLVAYVALYVAAISRQVVSILKVRNEKDKAVLISLLISLIALVANLQFQYLYLNIFLFIYLGFVEAVRGALSYQVDLKS